MLHFNGKVGRCDATILIDSGATFNCISSDFITKNRLKTKIVQGPLVHLADGTRYECNSILPLAKIRIGPYTGKAPAYVLPLKGNDVILGNDWLTLTNPLINWREKTVTINQHGQTIVLRPNTNSSSFISAKEATRAIHNGALGYLALIHEVDTSFLDPLMTTHAQENTTSNQPTPKPDPYATQDPSHKAQLEAIVTTLKEKFRDVMPNELPDGLPPSREVDHAIDLIPGAVPPKQRYYRLSIEEEREVDKQIDEGLRKGWITPSKSSFGSPVLVVKKKDGSMRVCIDYRLTNRLTVPNVVSLSHISDLIDQTYGAKYFTKLDLRSGYYQVRIRAGDEYKTAFRTRTGHYEYLVMPFGLTNAPATFQTMMNDTLRDYLNKFVVVHIDDILIYSKTLEDHVRHVEAVLTKLREEKLYVKETKCEWFRTEVTFLGHRLSADGTRMEDDKIKAILDWPSLTSTKEILSFLGLVGFYRQYIRHFAHITSPLTDLLKKDATFVWGLEQQQAFDTLKTAITTAPILQVPNPNLPFVLTTDASSKALGAELAQDQGNGLRPVAFYSRKFNKAETNYPVHERETLALIASLKHWRHYLKGAPRGKAFTDHHSLKHLATQPTLTPRQARWIELLQEYHIHIDYLPGKRNVVADALSRRPDLCLNAITTIHTLGDVLSKVSSTYGNDDESTALLSKANAQLDGFLLRDNLILKTQANGSYTLYIPPSDVRQHLLHEHHDTIYAGHLGMDKTYECLTRNYYWPTMRDDVRDYVRSCPKCQANKPTNRQPIGLLQPLNIPHQKWEQVTMDLITALPRTTRGHDAIGVVVDKLTKMVHFFPTTTSVTAPQLATLFFDCVVRLHGLPRSIVSDRDPRFTSKFWEALMTKCGTTLARSTAYHPQTDGQTERVNRTLEEALRAYVNDTHTDWDDHLSGIEFAINNSPHASTKQTPFFLNYGVHPLTPSSLDLSTLTSNQGANDFLTRLHDDLETARFHLQRAQERQSRYANTKRRPHTFKIGDQVLLSTSNYRRRQPGSHKFDAPWDGPFRISEIISPTAIRLDLPPSMKIHPVVNASYLKPYHTSSTFHPRPPLRPPPIAGNDIYLAERILDKRIINRGCISRAEYLIQWQGYPIYDATWEPATNLLGSDIQAQRAAFDAVWTPPPSSKPRSSSRARGRTLPMGEVMQQSVIEL